VGVAEDAGFEPARACTQPAFQVCPRPVSQCLDQTARRRTQAWQPIMNRAERSRMRLKLRLALRPNWRNRGPRRPADGVEPRALKLLTPLLQSGGAGLVERHSSLASREQAHPQLLGWRVCCCSLLLQVRDGSEPRVQRLPGQCPLSPVWRWTSSAVCASKVVRGTKSFAGSAEVSRRKGSVRTRRLEPEN
jgi:hypothetical protein